MIPELQSPVMGRDPTIKLLRASFRHDRMRICVVAVFTLGAAVTAALFMHPTYEAKSSLLVMLGSEYTYRPSAGENMNVSNALDREQILRTEIEILDTSDLHRQVIQDIGVARLYPGLLAPPGLLSQAKVELDTAAAKAWTFLGLGTPQLATEPERVIDPVEAALSRMNSQLTFEAVKDGNAINITFSHPDPDLAAEVINKLEDGYLTRRRDLYVTREAGYVNDEVTALRKRLDVADGQLADFKVRTGISDLQARRAVLINQQGQLESDLRIATGQSEQDTARMAQLDHQLHTLPDAYMTALNPVMVQLQLETAKVRADLLAVKAQMITDGRNVADVVARLKELDANEQEMSRLALARDVLTDNYKAAVKVRDDRMLTENVEMNRASNVRVLQKAVPPLEPVGQRRLIVIAAALLTPLVAGGVGLLMHFFRSGYLLPEAVELDTGLRVLMSVPDRRRSAKGILLLPGKAT